MNARAVLPLLAMCATAVAGAPGKKTYKLSVDDTAGGKHVIKVTTTLPDHWGERMEKDGSPSLLRDPAGMVAGISGHEMSAETVIKTMFYDAKTLTRTTKPGARLWVVDKQADGGIHAGLFIPEDKAHVVMCEIRLGAKHVDLYDEVAKVCDAIAIVK